MGQELRELFDKVAADLRQMRVMSERNLALIATADLDEKLQGLLDAFFIDTYAETKEQIFKEAGPLGTLKARVDLAFLLGIISEREHGLLHLIRKIRNKFAHSPNVLRLSDPPLSDWCRNLDVQLPMHEETLLSESFRRFVAALVFLFVVLYHRRLEIKRLQLANSVTYEEVKTWTVPDEAVSDWLKTAAGVAQKPSSQTKGSVW